MTILRTVKKMQTNNIAYRSHPQGGCASIFDAKSKKSCDVLLNHGWKGKGHMLVCNHINNALNIPVILILFTISRSLVGS